MTQFNRNYSLTVIPKEEGIGIVIKLLRIHFVITRTILGFPNLAYIELYNASDSTVNTLREKYTKIQLEVGYGENISLIFKGDIRNIFQSQTDVDSITRIYAGDGQLAFDNSTYNKTMTNNITTDVLVADVAESFKSIRVGELNGLPAIASNLLGQTLSGASKDVMNQLATAYGFEWSVQDEELITQPITGLIREEQAILITSKTGMLGSPTLTETGVDVTTLLHPNIVPNSTIKIESAGTEVSLGDLQFKSVKPTKATGLYRVQEVIYDGDTHFGDWISNIKARPVS